MKISAINNINNNFYIPTFKSSKVEPFVKPQQNMTLPMDFAGQSKVYIDSINKLKEETRRFPKDIEYRKNLLINAGLNPRDYYKLRPIIGSQEIQSIMKNFDSSEKPYSVGFKDINLKTNNMRANLHIHTLASDGALSTEELLNKAAKYANAVVLKHPEYKNAPFTIAITDHDTTETTKEAIKVIAKDPIKYRNLRVILGTEMTTFNTIAPEIMKRAVNTHVLAYAIDPNEKIYSNFIETTKLNKNFVKEKMIQDVNEIYRQAHGKDLVSVKEAQKYSNPLKKNIIGIANHVERYVENKFVISEILPKNEKLTKALIDNNISTNPDDLMKMLCENNRIKYSSNRTSHSTADLTKMLEEKTNIPQNELNEFIKNELKNSPLFDKIDKKINDYRVSTYLDQKYQYLPKFEDLYNGLKGQKDAMIGLAHPLNNLKDIPDQKNQIEFLKDFYSKFKAACKEKAKFSEVYYQSYDGAAKLASKTDEIKNLLNKMSKIFNLFRTGSADSHTKNIFKRFS